MVDPSSTEPTDHQNTSTFPSHPSKGMNSSKISGKVSPKSKDMISNSPMHNRVVGENLSPIESHKFKNKIDNDFLWQNLQKSPITSTIMNKRINPNKMTLKNQGQKSFASRKQERGSNSMVA